MIGPDEDDGIVVEAGVFYLVDAPLYEIIELGDSLEEPGEVSPYGEGVGVDGRDIHILRFLPLVGF